MTTFKTLSLSAAALVFALPVLAQNTPGAHFIENWDADGDGKISLAEATEKRTDIFTMFDMDDDNSLSASEYDAFDETRAEDLANNAQPQAGQGMGQGQGAGQGKNMGNGMGNGMGKGKQAQMQGQGMGQGQGQNQQGMGQGQGRGNVRGVTLGDYVQSMDRSFVDANKDGTVTRAEFEGFSAEWFATRDRNGDGFITEADFGPAK